jgi:hypothetical protein
VKEKGIAGPGKDLHASTFLMARFASIAVFIVLHAPVSSLHALHAGAFPRSPACAPRATSAQPGRVAVRMMASSMPPLGLTFDGGPGEVRHARGTPCVCAGRVVPPADRPPRCLTRATLPGSRSRATRPWRSASTTCARSR